jgi:hypothetical protein
MSNQSSEKEERAIHNLNCSHAMTLVKAIAEMQSFSGESLAFFIQIYLYRKPSVLEYQGDGFSWNDLAYPMQNQVLLVFRFANRVKSRAIQMDFAWK